MCFGDMNGIAVTVRDQAHSPFTPIHSHSLHSPNFFTLIIYYNTHSTPSTLQSLSTSNLLLISPVVVSIVTITLNLFFSLSSSLYIIYLIQLIIFSTPLTLLKYYYYYQNFPIANGMTTDLITIVFFSLQSLVNKISPVSLRLIYHFSSFK